MRKLSLLALLGIACGCGGGSSTAIRAADKMIRTHVSPHEDRKITFAPEPAVPPEIEEGSTTLLAVTPAYENGEACRFCKVRWTTNRRDIAVAYEPSTPCASRRCVVLEGVKPGEAILLLEICPSEYSDCVRREFEVEVVPQ